MPVPNAPPISRELVAWLEAIFPNVCPAVDVPIDEVRARAGEARVVAKIKATHEAQQEEPLEDFTILTQR